MGDLLTPAELRPMLQAVIPGSAAVYWPGTEVPLDVTDPFTIEVFTEGECWALAYALHRLTGWPLIGLGDPGMWDHVMVAHPDGGYVDIEGITTHEAAVKSWGAAWPMVDPDWFEVSTDPEQMAVFAEPFARLVLAAIGLPWSSITLPEVP